MFCRGILPRSQQYDLLELTATPFGGRLHLVDFLQTEGEGPNATWVVDLEMMRELLSEATTDRLLQKQIDHIRAFAFRTQQVGHWAHAPSSFPCRELAIFDQSLVSLDLIS